VVGESDDRFARYDSPNAGDMVYEQPGPLDKLNEFTPAIKQNAKKIVIGIAAIVVIYLLLDFLVLSQKPFTITVTDTEGNPILTNTISIYSGDSAKSFFSSSAQASYSVSMKPGSYRVEASGGSSYKPFNKTIEANAGTPIEIKIEKDMDLEIGTFDFPSELYSGQDATASVSVTNNSEKTENIELVFEGDLKEFKSAISSEPKTITLLGNNTTTATIRLSVPENIAVKNTKDGDNKKAIVRVKYTNAKSEAKEYKLYAKPVFELSPKKITKTINADSQKTNLTTISVKNKTSFPIKNISLSIDDDTIKNWFSFEPYSTIPSLEPKETAQITVWAVVPIGTNPETVTPNIIASTSGAQEIVTTGLTIKAAKLDFIATPSKDTINIPKDSAGTGYRELIGEYIKLQNKGVVDIENIDVEADVACRDSWITFPQGKHVDKVSKGTTKEVSLRITAPPTATENLALSCQLTVDYDDPLSGEKRQQVINLFLVPKP